MAEKVLMIALSPTMEQGTIVSWQKKEGDTVATGDLLCQVETDKATMDYESAQDGTLLKVLVPEGSQASVGEPIAVIGKPGEDFASLLAEIPSAKKTGTAPEAGPAGTARAGRATPEETTPRPVKAEAERQTSAGRAEPEANREPAPAAAPSAERREEPRRQQPEAFTADGGLARAHIPGRVKASPLARKIAAQKGVDLSYISGTGTGGRIVREDVETFTPGAAGLIRRQEPGRGERKAEARETLEEVRIPVTGKRAVIAKRLSESKFSAPHFYLRKAVFMEEIFRARETLNAKRKEKVGLNAFILKLCAEAIRKHPVINSTWAGDAIVRHGSVDIGLAVALPDGLIVPVVRNCETKGIVEIDGELRELIDRARANTLKPEDFTGATFTVSNLGAYGMDEFTAIINPPGSAILAVGAAKKEPVVVDDEIVIRQVMRLTLSCDHRVIDGATGAEFLAELSAIMENPMAALF